MALSLRLLAGAAVWAAATILPGEPPSPGRAPACALPDSTEYYRIDLVPTRLVPGTGASSGSAEVLFAPTPFGIALAPDGNFRLRVHVAVDRLPTPPGGARFVAWVTTPEVDEKRRLGALDETGRTSGEVSWNKFLVVVTLEATPADSATTWAGPVVLRGMARSGKMHTMAGHGPFEQERCATYGY